MLANIFFDPVEEAIFKVVSKRKFVDSTSAVGSFVIVEVLLTIKFHF